MGRAQSKILIPGIHNLIEMLLEEQVLHEKFILSNTSPTVPKEEAHLEVIGHPDVNNEASLWGSTPLVAKSVLPLLSQEKSIFVSIYVLSGTILRLPMVYGEGDHRIGYINM